MEEQFIDWVERQTREGFVIVVAPWEHGVTISQGKRTEIGSLEILVSVGESTVERAFKKLREEIAVPFTHAKKPIDPTPVEKAPDAGV